MKTKINQSIKNIEENKIIYIILAIYIFLGNVASHTVYSEISIVLVVLVGIFSILKNKKIYFDKYFIIYFAFMLYQLLLIIFNVVLYKNITILTLKTMIINAIVMIVIYNLLISTKNYDKFFNIYVIVSVISLVLIIFLSRDNLFKTRLAHTYGKGATSFYFLGKAISLSANSIAFFCDISILFLLYMFNKEKKKSYIILMIFLAMGVLLTGSRKGIIILVLYLIFAINLYSKKSKKTKIIATISVVVGTLFLVIAIPVFYNLIGKRLIEMFLSFVGINTTEGSILARARYKKYAIENIKNNPIFGFGVGNFKQKYGNVTESNYLEMLVSGGIVGLIIYYSYAVSIIKDFIKSQNRNKVLTNMFLILISIWIIEYGSVTYLSRSYLIFIILYLAYYNEENKLYKEIKLDKIFQIIKSILLKMAEIGFFNFMNDEMYIKFIYLIKMGKRLDLAKVQTFNEKLQWLKLNDRNEKYTSMVDKYQVKEYVANIIGEEYIIPTLEVVEKFDDIDFDKLPNQFVIKCTHDSGRISCVQR